LASSLSASRGFGVKRPRHSREDEYSYVLEDASGRCSATRWRKARLLEIISPAGFERYFAGLVELVGSTRAAPEDLAALGARYGLEVDPKSIPELVNRFELTFPGEPI
jgi:hypothetical protein